MGMISSRQPRLSFTKVMGKQSRRSCGKAKRIVVPRRRSVPVGVVFPGILHFVDVRHPIFVAGLDRKSTRLNSSHTVISYAVFCLKKKMLLPRNVSRH